MKNQKRTAAFIATLLLFCLALPVQAQTVAGGQSEALYGPYYNAGSPSNGTSEVQTITLTGTPTGGTYRLIFEGFRTASIAYDAAAATVQTALRALPSIGSSGVGVSGSAGGPYTVTFTGNRQKQAIATLFALDTNALTGGTDPTVEIEETTAGVTATARGALPGARLLDTDTGVWYTNNGTALAPTWETPDFADGSVNPAKFGLGVRNETGGELAIASLVYLSGWNESEGKFLITLADADAAGARAAYILQAAIANNANGTAFKTHRLTAVNTSAAGAVGDPVYLSTTPGGWTLTAPTGNDDTVQIVGRVAVDDASGEIEFDLSSLNQVKIANNELQSLSVGTAQIAANAVTTAKIETDMVQYVDVQMTNAEVLALRAAPKVLVASPGANRAILVHSIYAVCSCAAGAYTESSDDLAVQYTSGGGDILVITSNGFVTAAAVTALVQRPAVAGSTTVTAATSVELFNNGDGELGDGNAANTLSVRVYYSVVDTVAFN